MKTLLFLVVMVAVAGLAVADVVDVTGKWSGSFNSVGPNGDTKESTALLLLKQNGTDITGTVGPDESEQFPIQKGTIEGDRITLEADHGGNVMKFDLKLASGRITGEALMSREGQSMKAKIDVGRAK